MPPRPPERAGGPVAPKAPPGHQRLARLLQSHHPDLSFTRAKEAVAAGQVLVDGAVATDPGAWVAGGAAVDWDPNRPRHRQERIEVVHLDADLVVVAKPAGLLTIPTTDGEERDTLLARVVRELRRRGERPHVEVVHRLDRETSGLLVFARGRDALHALQAQLLDRSMGRVYTAVVEGEMHNSAGTFDRALVGDGLRTRRWVAGPGQVGKASITHWRVTERFAGATRVEARLETGRTHQIRIHFAAAGHPLLGDAVYRPAGSPPFPLPVPRVALHAGELYLVHPRDGRRERFRLPVPADLEELLERLRAASPKS